MIAQYFTEYQSLGLRVIPVEWDINTKSPVSHTEWSKDQQYKVTAKHNGLMIQTHNEYACLDFDLKNTSRKSLYDEWLTILINDRPEIYDKVYVEQTRNAGYHVWIKYAKLTHKLSLADSEKGSEVIALYAMNPLVYTYPTPGYTEVHASMGDVDYLSDSEYEYIIGLSQYFNEYKPSYDPNKKAISYPAGYEELLSSFDNLLPNDAWVELLSQIGLEEISNYRKTKKQHFTAYRRKESTSDAISAKVYFKMKRVCIFSASLHDFPNWHNRHEYPVWSLPPSFVLFYKNNRDWEKVVEEVKLIADAASIDLPETKPNTSLPLHVFPDHIADSIRDVAAARSISPDFVAMSCLWTISSLAGTRYHSDFNSEGKNILFCIMVAPVSVGKTPAYHAACETPLRPVYASVDKKFDAALEEWEAKKALAAAKKKSFTDPRPNRFIPIAKDGTTEGYIQKSMTQPSGIGVYQDEAETILNAGSFKATNDAISFFTQAFSGGRVSQVRADSLKERVVPNLNLNLLMGTQPDRLKHIFTDDRISSGFASRFLMVQSDYLMLNIESDPFGKKKEMCQEWVDITHDLFWDSFNFNIGNGAVIEIQMSEEAKDIYRTYYKAILNEANNRILSRVEKYVIGTEAKMSAYFPRLTQILAILHNHKKPVVTPALVHAGHTLYRYFADSTIRIISELQGEIENGLPKELELLYQTLPDLFTSAEAKDTCIKLNLAARRFETSVRRKDFGKLFKKLQQGQYQKL